VAHNGGDVAGRKRLFARARDYSAMNKRSREEGMYDRKKGRDSGIKAQCPVIDLHAADRTSIFSEALDVSRLGPGITSRGRGEGKEGRGGTEIR